MQPVIDLSQTNGKRNHTHKYSVFKHIGPRAFLGNYCRYLGIYETGLAGTILPRTA